MWAKIRQFKNQIGLQTKLERNAEQAIVYIPSASLSTQHATVTHGTRHQWTPLSGAFTSSLNATGSGCFIHDHGVLTYQDSVAEIFLWMLRLA